MIYCTHTHTGTQSMQMQTGFSWSMVSSSQKVRRSTSQSDRQDGGKRRSRDESAGIGHVACKAILLVCYMVFCHSGRKLHTAIAILRMRTMIPHWPVVHDQEQEPSDFSFSVLEGAEVRIAITSLGTLAADQACLVALLSISPCIAFSGGEPTGREGRQF